MRDKRIRVHRNINAPDNQVNQRFVNERADAVTVLEILLEELLATANDLNLPGNKRRPDIIVSYSMTASGNQNVTGFSNVWPGRKCIVINEDGADNIVLQHQNAGSTAPHRLISPTAADYTLGPNESAILSYSGRQNRWIIIAGTGA